MSCTQQLRADGGVHVAHCSGDQIVFYINPTTTLQPVERVAVYLKLCYVHQASCAFAQFNN
jgi:hypothetical protein